MGIDDRRQTDTEDLYLYLFILFSQARADHIPHFLHIFLWTAQHCALVHLTRARASYVMEAGSFIHARVQLLMGTRYSLARGEFPY